MANLAEITAALSEWFNPKWAEPWDAVGLVCGNPTDDVKRILLAIDPTPSTVAEAIDNNAQLLVTHHPLLLSGVHGVPASEPKGALIHKLIRGGAGLYVAHTNADVATPGVSDALADRIGLLGVGVLKRLPGAPWEKLVVTVPVDYTEKLIDALTEAGAGRLGDYTRVAYYGTGSATFEPQQGAHPTFGSIGERVVVAENRLEMVIPVGCRSAVISALRAVHPYEEPAFDLFSQVVLPGPRGFGRIGRLPQPMTLREFTAHVAEVLPSTVWGVRAAGDPNRQITRVAVAAGSSGDLTGAAQAAHADVFVTADLKHHRTNEAVTEQGPAAMALVDAAHWATEAPWLDVLGARIKEKFGSTVKVDVSEQVTDPWTVHVPSTETSLRNQ